MKSKQIHITVCLVALLGFAGLARAEALADNFDGTVLDASKWNSYGAVTVSGGKVFVPNGGWIKSKAAWAAGTATFHVSTFGNGLANPESSISIQGAGGWRDHVFMFYAGYTGSKIKVSNYLNNYHEITGTDTPWAKGSTNLVFQIQWNKATNAVIYRAKDEGDAVWDFEQSYVTSFNWIEDSYIQLTAYADAAGILVDSVVVEYPSFSDIAYLALFVQNWLRNDCETVNVWCSTSDWNGDAKVNFADFATIAGGWPYLPDIPAKIACFPSVQKLNVSVDAESVLVLGAVHFITISLQDANGVMKSTQTKIVGTDANAEFEFDISALAAGNYTLHIECFKSDGTMLKSSDKSWDKLDSNPDWMANPVGAERRVPTPFSPVSTTILADGTIDVAMWGRTYLFNQSLYPTQIQSQSLNLLGAPVRLVGTINGTSLDASSAAVAVLENTTDRAVLSSDCTTNGVSIHTQTTIEFDGMFLSTLTLTPNTAGRTIESLKVEIPFDPTKAALMHWNDCNVSAPGWSGQTPTNWSGPFHPVVWLGNETAGLCWFAESANGWNNVSADSRLKISTADGCTVFTLNFIDKQVALNQPLTITFGFTATPTKPMPKGWLMDKHITLDPWWDESNQFLHEAIPWEKWHEQLDKIHRAGGKMLKYTQTNYLSFYGDQTPEEAQQQNLPGTHYFNTPEKKFWQAEWEAHPQRGLGPYANVFCTKTTWRNLVAAGLKDRMVHGGIDGIYFDCSMPNACSSSIHGCDGGYDILGQRDIRRRLYNIFDELGKDGILFEHISDNMLGPVMNFSTYHYDGEQFSSGVADYRTKLSLARLRAFSIGTNWGHIPKFMAFAYGDDVSTQSLMALWTLHMPWHDVHGWVSSVGEAARLVDRDFDFSEDTTRLGYWENTAIVGNQSNTVKSTIYYKPTSMLIVVSNLSDVDVNVALPLNTTAIGFNPSKLKIISYLNNQVAAPSLAGEALVCDIKANSCLMCELANDGYFKDNFTFSPINPNFWTTTGSVWVNAGSGLLTIDSSTGGVIQSRRDQGLAWTSGIVTFDVYKVGNNSRFYLANVEGQSFGFRTDINTYLHAYWPGGNTVGEWPNRYANSSGDLVIQIVFDNNTGQMTFRAKGKVDTAWQLTKTLSYSSGSAFNVNVRKYGYEIPWMGVDRITVEGKN